MVSDEQLDAEGLYRSEELERMLEVLKDEGEEAALAYVRKRIKQGGHAPSLYY